VQQDGEGLAGRVLVQKVRNIKNLFLLKNYKYLNIIKKKLKKRLTLRNKFF
jgi:hypothetical protein